MAALDSCEAAGRRAAVHCSAGEGRVGLVLTAWLAHRWEESAAPPAARARVCVGGGAPWCTAARARGAGARGRRPPGWLARPRPAARPGRPPRRRRHAPDARARVPRKTPARSQARAVI